MVLTSEQVVVSTSIAPSTASSRSGAEGNCTRSAIFWVVGDTVSVAVMAVDCRTPRTDAPYCLSNNGG